MHSFKSSTTFYLAVIGIGVLINAAAFASRALQEIEPPPADVAVTTTPPVPSPAVSKSAHATLSLSEIAKHGEVYILRVLGEGWTRGLEKTIYFFDNRIHEKVSLFGDDACGEDRCRDDQIDLTIQIPETVIPGAHRLTVSEGDAGLRAELVVAIPPPEQIKVQKERPKISLVEPPMATVDVSSIRVLGEHWGPYALRTTARAWLLPPEHPENGVEVSVTRNYNDDELSLSIELSPEARALPPRDYILYVITNAGHEATAPFFLIPKPDLSGVAKPTIVLNPKSGPIGSYVVMTAAGFSPRTGGVVRFDGVQFPNLVVTDERGAFDNAGFAIPRTIEKDGKIIVLGRGIHTVEVDAGNGQRAKASFEITEGEHTPETKKEKDAVLKDEKKKSEDLKKDEREQKKLYDEVKKKADEITALKKKLSKKKSIADFLKKLDALKKKKSALDSKIQIELYSGKPCSADLAITFQRGCIPPRPLAEPARPYAGKPCDTSLPRVWQEGCVAPPTASPPVSYYAKDSEGKPCRPELAITFQPGCIPPPPATGDPLPSAAGKKCDPSVPSYSQKGCVP
ncbi:hypothetical protein HY627_01000 [Candidatus Uhrbacteria bacterium]|nr:hypothetical protein [Candidatus Uhrbacteria bacterium]